MKYEQRNPLPIPHSGPSESVTSPLTTIFDWEYALERENLLSLYEKGKEATWNAADLDWSIEVDLEKMVRERVRAYRDAGVTEAVLRLPTAGRDEVMPALDAFADLVG